MLPKELETIKKMIPELKRSIKARNKVKHLTNAKIIDIFLKDSRLRGLSDLVDIEKELSKIFKP